MVGIAAIRGQDFLRTCRLHLPTALLYQRSPASAARPGVTASLAGTVKQGDVLQEDHSNTPAGKIHFPGSSIERQ